LIRQSGELEAERSADLVVGQGRRKRRCGERRGAPLTGGGHAKTGEIEAQIRCFVNSTFISVLELTDAEKFQYLAGGVFAGLFEAARCGEWRCQLILHGHYAAQGRRKAGAAGGGPAFSRWSDWCVICVGLPNRGCWPEGTALHLNLMRAEGVWLP
jgi:hypothetical protein